MRWELGLARHLGAEWRRTTSWSWVQTRHERQNWGTGLKEARQGQCVMTCSHHYGLTQYFHCPKNPPCFTPLSLVIPDIFTVFIVVSFPECHRVGIIHYAAFQGCLLSLNHTYLRFLHIFSWLDRSFLFSTQ